MRRTQEVTLKTGVTVNVLPREIPGLKAAGLLSKDTKARKPAKVTPRVDEKVAAARKVIADRIAAQEADAEAKAEADKAEAEKAEAEKKAAEASDNPDKDPNKKKDEKDPGETKEEKGTGETKQVKGTVDQKKK